MVFTTAPGTAIATTFTHAEAKVVQATAKGALIVVEQGSDNLAELVLTNQERVRLIQKLMVRGESFDKSGILISVIASEDDT